MRTQYEYKKALSRAVQLSKTESQLANMIANVILGEMDVLMSRAWSDLKDMGLAESQLMRAKKVIKRRL